MSDTLDPDDETPMAKMAREIMAREEHDRRAVAELLASLTPADAHTPLIPWMEVKAWNLKRTHKRK